MSIVKRNILAATLVIILIFVGIATFIPFKQALVFYEKNTDHLETFLPLQAGDTFQLIWKHSIHLTDVVEKYEVLDNGDIKQNEIIYQQFGIGMPSYALDGEEFVYEDGKNHIKNLNNVFPSIKLRNGKTVSKNRLVWGNDDQYIIPLNKYFDPGDWFTLKIEHLSLWDYLRGVEIRE